MAELIEEASDISEQAQRIERDLSGIRRALRKPLLAEVAKGELTVPQTAVMRIVVRDDGISLKDLSHAVSLAHSTVSGIVDRLEKQGLVERRPDSADGRINRIHATPSVREFVHNRLPALTSEPLVAALGRTSAHERESIEHALRRLRELLEQT